ncbi:MAG: endonuclease/exonuclease/phosphatase family protein [Kiritimatiellales bacterium]|nr:endonuclease/exonuclease/phosphatase family protein [Kiritimatiellales bacterium]
MCQLKLNRPISSSLLLLAAAACLAGCSDQNRGFDYSRGADEFAVMTYNLHQYTAMDRDGGGTDDDPKPEDERKAVVALIQSANPDVLAVQEMGNELYFHEFRAQLKAAGLEYPYADLLRRGAREINLAVLSRFPIIENIHHTNEWYSVGKAKIPVSRGYLESVIQVNENYRFHLLNAHLKSKVYSPLGQTEMRRNEARLLNKTARGIMTDHPGCNLLVVGDMNDNPDSAAIREVTGKSKQNLADIRPVEPGGDVWTHYSDDSDTYARIDYLFVNVQMLPELIRGKATVLRSRQTYKASDHRPVIGVFRAVDEVSVSATEPPDPAL